MVKVTTPTESSQFIVTYVTSTSAVFDTMKNSKVSTNKIPTKEVGDNGAVDRVGDGEGEGDENRRAKEEKQLICDKVIFATGGSRYVPEK